MKRGKLSTEEHMEAANDLKTIHEKLLAVLTLFANKVGRTKEPCLSLQKAHKLVYAARSEAEKLFYRDHRSLAVGLMKTHFGQTILGSYGDEVKAEKVKQFEQPKKE